MTSLCLQSTNKTPYRLYLSQTPASLEPSIGMLIPAARRSRVCNLKLIHSMLRINDRVTEARRRKQLSGGRRVSYPENTSKPGGTFRKEAQHKSTG